LICAGSRAGLSGLLRGGKSRLRSYIASRSISLSVRARFPEPERWRNVPVLSYKLLTGRLSPLKPVTGGVRAEFTKATRQRDTGLRGMVRQ
jgi:hypothetical protein